MSVFDLFLCFLIIQSVSSKTEQVSYDGVCRKIIRKYLKDKTII
jgi:hypothetical protein